LSQTNESATVPKTFHFSELNKASDKVWASGRCGWWAEGDGLLACERGGGL